MTYRRCGSFGLVILSLVYVWRVIGPLVNESKNESERSLCHWVRYILRSSNLIESDGSES